MTDTKRYPPKPERCDRFLIGGNAGINDSATELAHRIFDGMEAHYQPQLADLQSRVEMLESRLCGLVEACAFDGVEMALAGNPNVIQRASDDFTAAIDAAKAALDTQKAPGGGEHEPG